MKAEFKTLIPNENIDADFKHLCGPNERYEIQKCEVNWEIQPSLRQYGIWSFMQVIKTVEMAIAIFDEESELEKRAVPFKVTWMDGYDIDLEIVNYNGKNEFTINFLELDVIKKKIKALI